MIKELLFSIENYMQAGGVVMIPILVISLCMWTLIINRLLVLHRLYIKNISRDTAGQLVKANQQPEENYRGINSLLVRQFLAARSHDPVLDSFILDETVVRLVSSLDTHLGAIRVMAGVAPLLGLLGTVIGMMETFDVITIFGTGNAKAMAGGISVALITTQTGLMVSIPGLYMSGFLTKRANNLKYKIAATGMYLNRFL
ncbi:MAG: MotA/TolQ/ExbB proton channel family protein [Proteobacteria bacterium]|nr:MotA/TolQ/ExbB proton channel family protein [Pseudomonadota bacterium]MBU1585223.1 MotA/TolQ/ExbB proton channel family protein [Pseudomonadota bacterium]MBU2431874.1 MotA/TolQ/ExbB proton channel family protein [Pseudomonadota bacterium]MBU2454536.1 MotA/TolQ/ExbB proton channel family protein [Pseudomonadota bacterium]MBU2629113.1 MotA/TolQ/ExbB proton channel family protein [Pseudomonadota bacterium]